MKKCYSNLNEVKRLSKCKRYKKLYEQEKKLKEEALAYILTKGLLLGFIAPKDKAKKDSMNKAIALLQRVRDSRIGENSSPLSICARGQGEQNSVLIDIKPPYPF